MAKHDSKKRKRHETAEAIDTSKPSKRFETSGKGRHHTLTIAVPGSIIANAQTHEAKTALAGQIARACAVYCVDEIVVYSDSPSTSVSTSTSTSATSSTPVPSHSHSPSPSQQQKHVPQGHTGWSSPSHFLAHLLTYLECPPFLRKRLFPMHPNLRTAGALPSLDLPHHPGRAASRAEEWWCGYREGVVLSSTGSRSGPGRRERGGNEKVVVVDVDVGLEETVEVECADGAVIPSGARVTVKLRDEQLAQHERGGRNGESKVRAVAVDPHAPRAEAGWYWGYSVRTCDSLSAVFEESPWEGGYDVGIGTSERGSTVEDVLPDELVPPALRNGTGKGRGGDGRNGTTATATATAATIRLPQTFRHLLIVFGGVAGLEAAAAADQALTRSGIGAANVNELFDAWVNTCPGQGSRTIRAEEALWPSLAAFKTYVDHCGASAHSGP